jgi:two-component system sensor histidine kinase FlrB
MKFAHSGTLEKSPVEMEDLFRDLSCVVEPLIAGAGCRFNIVNDAWYSTVMANREALLCALENLIMNAIDACGADGVITLYAAPAGAGRIEVLVRDNGKGIETADRDRIFEQFYTDKPRGTGLGLSIVRSVAAAHGSEVTLESEPGKGATFGMILQQADCGARAAEPVQALSLTA